LVLSIPLDLGGKQCRFVIVDDYSRFTLVLFLKHKDESFDAFKTYCKIVQNEKGSNIISVRSNHGGEFGISHSNHFFMNMVFLKKKLNDDGQ
jgi:hypothetical protein